MYNSGLVSKQRLSMQYKIIDAKSPVILVELVNQALRNGWKPQGGVSVTMSSDQGYVRELYAQAMIKESE